MKLVKQKGNNLWCVCSFDDSQSEAADPDAAHPPVPPQRASAVGASGHKPQIEAQQAKHAGMGREGVPKGPPQQSRCKWQTKGSAQVMIALWSYGIVCDIMVWWGCAACV